MKTLRVIRTAMANLRPFRMITVITVFAPLGFTANVYAKLDVGLSSSNYLGQGEVGRKDNQSALDLLLDTKSESPGLGLDTRVLIQAEIGFSDSSYRFIEFPDLYVATSKAMTGPYQASLGRRLTAWSAIDDTWGTGTFQPRFRWDYLRPQEVGLLGLYQELKTGPVKVTVFYSPIYIPDRGAPIDFADGRIRSTSPWTVNPPYSTEIERKTVPVRYDAVIPPTSEIIRQNTIATSVSVGEAEGLWSTVSYAYKPMNELLMSYEGYLSTALNNGDAHATLYPRVGYHHVASLDVGTHGKWMSATISGTADHPTDRAPIVHDRVSQQVGNMYLLSPTFTVNPFGDARGGSASLSYLRVFGRDPPDVGNSADPATLADGVSSEFDSRYPFKSAFMLSAALPPWHRFTVDFRLLYDVQDPGTIVSWMFTYAPERKWKLFFATDVLSSFTGDSADGTDFIHRYRENDRATGGVTYVF